MLAPMSIPNNKINFYNFVSVTEPSMLRRTSWYGRATIGSANAEPPRNQKCKGIWILSYPLPCLHPAQYPSVAFGTLSSICLSKLLQAQYLSDRSCFKFLRDVPHMLTHPRQSRVCKRRSFLMALCVIDGQLPQFNERSCGKLAINLLLICSLLCMSRWRTYWRMLLLCKLLIVVRSSDVMTMVDNSCGK